MKSTLTHPIFLIMLLASWLIIPSVTTAEPPYPPSTVFESVTFDRSSHTTMAKGSDNWPITWADDDHQYTSWGDGWGFSEQGEKQSLGFARIEGFNDTYTVHDIWGDPSYAANPSQSGFQGKSYGIISISGVLYAWWGPGSNTTSYNETKLLISIDHGATWEKSSWDMTDTDNRLIMPTICNFGRDYAGARDHYVYHYFIRKQGNPSSLNVHRPGLIDLARVPKDSMMDRSEYKFFAGLDDNGVALWTSDAAKRVAVFEDPNGVGWNLSVSYNQGLGRYILMTEHSRSMSGNLGVFDAPEPWGPWTTVGYYTNWLDTETTFFWNMSNKWLSADGKNFTMVFTGTGSYDSWNTIRGTFAITQDPPIVPNPPGNLRIISAE